MRLFSLPQSSATVAHAALLETGEPFELVQGARRDRVPALDDGGCRICEGAAILLYLGDRFPSSPLAPAPGTPERADYYQWTVFLASVLQPAFGRWYAPRFGAAGALAASIAAAAEGTILGCLDACEARLGDRDFLARRFSSADLLLHMLSGPSWTLELPVLATRPNLAAHHARVDARPAVQAMAQAHARDREAER